MKKAFTLVELLIVIGILGILMGVILSQFGGATDSSRLAVCQSNMRNLAQACQSYAMSSGFYPRAATSQYVTMNSDGDMLYGIYSGWIGRTNDHQNRQASEGKKTGDNIGCYIENDQDMRAAITNGTLFASLSSDYKSYVCPAHARSQLVKDAKVTPHFSYAMNGYFGYDSSNGQEANVSHGYPGIEYGTLQRADRRLLFAEIPFTSLQNAKTSTGYDSELDCVLTYKDDGESGIAETIGFNHKSGKLTIAHVVFADCHTAKINLPKNADNGSLQDLTEWLCKGYDVVYVGGNYEKVDESATEE